MENARRQQHGLSYVTQKRLEESKREKKTIQIYTLHI